MSYVTLWTLQYEGFVTQLEIQDPYFASWKYATPNHRIAYEWMADQLSKTTGLVVDSPPIWCWHSCNGRVGGPPTAATALSLDSGFRDQLGFIIELSVPQDSVLLSSYYAWNGFLNYAFEHKSISCSRKRKTWLFEPPLIKHADDDIQAVIPYIKHSWIRRISPLKNLDRSSKESL